MKTEIEFSPTEGRIVGVQVYIDRDLEVGAEVVVYKYPGSNDVVKTGKVTKVFRNMNDTVINGRPHKAGEKLYKLDSGDFYYEDRLGLPVREL